MGKNLPPFHSNCWQNLFLWEYLTEAPRIFFCPLALGCLQILEATCSSTSSEFLYRCLLITSSIQGQSLSSEWLYCIWHKIVMGVMSDYLCHILLIIRKSPIPSTFRRWGLCKGIHTTDGNQWGFTICFVCHNLASCRFYGNGLYLFEKALSFLTLQKGLNHECVFWILLLFFIYSWP